MSDTRNMDARDRYNAIMQDAQAEYRAKSAAPLAALEAGRIAADDVYVAAIAEARERQVDERRRLEAVCDEAIAPLRSELRRVESEALAQFRKEWAVEQGAPQ